MHLKILSGKWRPSCLCFNEFTVWNGCSASCSQHLACHVFQLVFECDFIFVRLPVCGIGLDCLVNVCWNRKSCVKLIYGGLLVSWDRWTFHFSQFDKCLIVELVEAQALTAGLEWWPIWLRGMSFPALRSPLFTQPLIPGQIKENSKAAHHWPLCGEFTTQMASNVKNVSISWRQHVFLSLLMFLVMFIYLWKH